MRVILRTLAWLAACLCLAGAPIAETTALAQDQAQSSAANCDPVTDPDQLFAENMCTAHPGCAIVVKLQRACAATKTFLKKVGDLFTIGGGKPLSNNEVYEAAEAPVSSPAAKRYVTQARAIADTALLDGPGNLRPTEFGTAEVQVLARRIDLLRNGGAILVGRRPRGERRRGSRELRAGQVDAPTFEPSIERAERHAMIEAALDQLPGDQREVVVMKVWGGLTFAQIAQALDIPLNTAASRYRYALARLETELSNEVIRE